MSQSHIQAYPALSRIIGTIWPYLTHDKSSVYQVYLASSRDSLKPQLSQFEVQVHRISKGKLLIPPQLLCSNIDLRSFVESPSKVLGHYTTASASVTQSQQPFDR